MKPDTINNDPAFPAMAMDILSNVLSRADNPGDLGTYLTEEIRDLTGARCVLLIQCLGAVTVTAHRIVSVNPLRRREWAESRAVNRLYDDVVHLMPTAQFWRGDEPSEVAGLLRREGFELSMAFPLNAGAFRVGAMLVLGLPDEEHISSVLDLLNNLSAIVALVLRNSFLFERQEQIIQERTAELRAGEEKYRTLIECANDAVFIHEIKEDGMPGPFIEVNELACRRLGYSREELARMSPMELDDPRYRDRIVLAMERLLKDGHAVFETAQMAKDGRSIPVEVSTRLLELKGKRLLFSIVRDITERKRAEEAIRASEQELRALFAAMNDAVFVINREGRYQKIPETNPSLLYKPTEDLLGKTLHEVFPGAQADIFIGSVSQALATHRPVNIEYKIRIGDNDFWFNATVSPMSEDAAVVVARNNTARKVAEEEIQRLKNYLANIIDSMPSVLVGMDRDETVTQWNRQAEEITGISATEAIGRPITDLLPDFSPWIKGMLSEIDQQRPASMEKLLIEKQGELRFYDLMLYPLIRNGVEGAVIRIEDVTERTRIQELMIQTEKMMSVGGLAAGMAHEINNPLGIITQAAQNIERRVSPELPANRKAAEELGVSLEGLNAYLEKRQIPEFIGSIREASLRASRIIANMLQFSRCAGTTIQPASLGVIIEQALELAGGDYDLKKKFDFRSIEIIRDYAPDMPEVPMVAVEMEQVMLNLLKNAAQAMILNPPDRRPRLTLRLRREEKYALIEVEDNGPGMEEEVRRRVFEPFFTTKEPGMGTGLGLSVSYMIVTQNHKGLMEVKSKSGKGACFRVRLPLKK
jgi:PAS domain S-box-containing protein